jgi:phosphate-selective porin OprO/OprP
MAILNRRGLAVRAHLPTASAPRLKAMSKASLLVCCGLLLALGIASLAQAQAGPDDIAAILRRLEQQDNELRALREQVNAQGNSLRLPSVAGAPGVGPNPPAPGASRSPGEESVGNLPDSSQIAALKGTSATFPTFRMTGFTQLDSAAYSQDPLNIATVGNAQNGTGFRRARLAVVGNAAEFTTYMMEVDFATAGRPSFFDLWVEQANIPYLGAVTVGQYVQPFSIDAESGFRHLPFLERSLPFLAFVPFRRVGAQSTNWTEDKRTVWANSVFRTGGFNNAPLGDDRFGLDIGDVGGLSYSTRLAHLLYYDEGAPDRYLWEIGASFDYSRLSQNTGATSGLTGQAGGGPSPFYQSKVLPEFGLLGYGENSQNFGNATNGTPIFIDSGRYAARSFEIFGVETAWQSGAWSAQAEWMATQVDSVVGPIFYEGAYAELMYRLTGENRVWDKRTASFKNPVPYTDFISTRPGGICGWGAWEVCARWSFVDERNPAALSGHYYNSVTNTYTGLAATGAIGNGMLNDVTVGLNWYLNAHTKLQFNWIHAILNNTAKGLSQADLIVSRVQVDF